MNFQEHLTINLQDLHVVVTGAARGLGAALSLSLSDLGCNVILCGRSLEALNVIAGHIETRTGRHSKIIELDLANAARVEAAAQEIILSFSDCRCSYQ